MFSPAVSDSVSGGIYLDILGLAVVDTSLQNPEPIGKNKDIYSFERRVCSLSSTC